MNRARFCLLMVASISAAIAVIVWVVWSREVMVRPNPNLNAGGLANHHVVTGPMTSADGAIPAGESSVEATASETTIRQLKLLRPFVLPGDDFFGPVSAPFVWKELIHGCMSKQPKWIKKSEVLARMRDATAVIVADHHTSPVPAIAAQDLLADLVAARDADAPQVSVVLEMVPRTRQDALDTLLSGALGQSNSDIVLHDWISECWPWPADPIVALVRTAARLGCPVAAAGWGCSISDYQANVADWRRQAFTMPRREFAWGDTPMDRTDANILDLLASGVRRRGGRGTMVVLVGADHIPAPSVGLRARLRVLGMTCVVVVPYCPELEIWLRSGGRGEPSPVDWLEISDGVYRPPTMSRKLIAELRVASGDYWTFSPDK